MSSDLIGASSKFRAVLEEISIVAPVHSAALVQRETGTGKEVIARAIHASSLRRHQPFIAINCATIPAALLESELFGHERGAFTGAFSPAMGRFQVADRGTLFLDEIGDLPLELQPKLLRVLQEQQFERLGGRHTLQVDVRLIDATNQDLWGMVQERKFRADLYYRLNVFPVTLPPLRERVQDIPLLANHFMRRFAERQGKVIDHIPHHVMAALTHYQWPGNIRELQNFIERAVIVAAGGELCPVMAELRKPVIAQSRPAVTRTLAEAERAHIMEALRETNWVTRHRDGITIERSADQLEEIQAASERAVAVSNLDREFTQLRNARAALRRVQEGSFGTCLQCDDDIHPKRLAAVPWATFCKPCQEAVDNNLDLEEIQAPSRDLLGRAA